MPGSVSSGTIRSGWLTDASRLESILTAALTDVSRRLTLERAVQVDDSPPRSSCSCSPPGRSSPGSSLRASLRWPVLLVLAALSVALALRRGGRASDVGVRARRRRLRRARSALGALVADADAQRSPMRCRFVLALGTCAALAWAAWGRPDTVSARRRRRAARPSRSSRSAACSCSRSTYDRAVEPATTEFAGALPGARRRARTRRRWCSRSASRSRATAAARGAALVACRRGRARCVAAARLDRRVRLARRAARRVRRPRGLRGAHGRALRGGRRSRSAASPLRCSSRSSSCARPTRCRPERRRTFVPPFAGHGRGEPLRADGRLRRRELRARGSRTTSDTRGSASPTRDDGARTLLGSSGRARGVDGRARARRRAADRSATGSGSRTRSFVDRYVNFNSSVPENSYLGLFAPARRRRAPALLATRFVAPVRGRRVGVSRPGRPCSPCCSPRVRRRGRGRARARGFPVLPLRRRATTPPLAFWLCRVPRSRLRRQRDERATAR